MAAPSDKFDPASVEGLMAVFGSLDLAWTDLAERGRAEPLGMARLWEHLEARYRTVADMLPLAGFAEVVAAVLTRQAALMRERVELEHNIRPLVRGWRRLPDLSPTARHARLAFDQRVEILRALDRETVRAAAQAHRTESAP